MADMKQSSPNRRKHSGPSESDSFIPESLRHQRLSGLPRSAELASVLRKLRVSTLGELGGVSLSDFQRLSDQGVVLFLEAGRLIERTKRGDFAIIPFPKGKRSPGSRPPPPSPHSADGKKEATYVPANPASEELDEIFIPLAWRKELLSAFPLSTRLQRIFKYQRFRLFGDLHGRSLSEIGGYRNCGEKTLQEAAALIRAIQHFPPTPDAVSLIEAATFVAAARGTEDAITVPAELHHLNVADLPLSVRLEGVLQRKGVRCLGDVQGVSLDDLRRTKNCGRKTIAELQQVIERAAAGEFTEAENTRWNPVELVQTLDALVSDLPDRNEAILSLRLGGRRDKVPTLEEVGGKYGLTRERIRQVIELSVERIRKRGGQRLRRCLEYVEEFCRDHVCPLTPALLEQWLGDSLTAARFNLAFYVRLLAKLKTTIPVWVAGSDSSSPSPAWRSDEIESALEAVLPEGSPALSLRQALVRVQARRNLGSVEVDEFLATLRHSWRFKVEFAPPDAPLVRQDRW